MIKLRNILFESPHEVEVEVQGKSQRAFEPGTGDISFIFTDIGNVYVGEEGGMHVSLTIHRDEGYFYKTNVNGRIFPKIKVISFWKCCTPYEMEDFITKLNKSLKQNKQYININLDEWYLDVIVPMQIYQDFDENKEKETTIKIREYIDRSFLYPWVKPSFNEDNYKVT